MSELFPEYRPSWETETHRAMRKHAAEFFRNEATPNQQRWADQNCVDRELWKKAGAAGLLGLTLPEEYGGGGHDFGMPCVVEQERVLALDTAFGFAINELVTGYLAALGNDEQRRRWLPRIVSGDAVLAGAMTEPGAGSDVQAIRTTARREGDDYVINGSKTFISNGTLCDLLLIITKTGQDSGAAGFSLIVAETDQQPPGFQRGRVLHKIGQHGQDTRELFFSDMRVPVANLLGEREGLGFYQAMEQLVRERLMIAVTAAAMAEAAVLETIRYAKQREAFGKPIANFQNTRFVLAECKAETLATRSMVDHAVGDHINGVNDPVTAAMVKLFATERSGQVIDKCLQIFGGYGYMMEYPIARLYAAARVFRIFGGTSEIMKEIVGRSL